MSQLLGGDAGNGGCLSLALGLLNDLDGIFIKLAELARDCIISFKAGDFLV